MEPNFNKFITFNLTPEEEAVGSVFHPLQAAVLQNRRADIAQNILNLRFDPLNPQQFGLDRAMLEGQMSILDWQLEVSSQQAEKAETASQSQPTDSKE